MNKSSDFFLKKKNIEIVIIKEIEKYLHNKRNNKILISLSGGVDSSVLYYIINKYKNKLKLKIHSIHFNYNVQNNAKSADVLCSNIAKEFKNKHVVFYPNISKKNFESNAREYRYKKIFKYADKYNIDFILTAHHLDDQLETVYMNTQNVNNWLSYVGIRADYGLLKRPMLSILKSDIINYAKQNNILWSDDLSNMDIKYKRNKARLIDLPKELANDSSFTYQLYKKHKSCLKKYISIVAKIQNDYTKYILSKGELFLKLDITISKIDDMDVFKLYIQNIFVNCFRENILLTQSHWKKLFDFIDCAKTGSIFHFNFRFIALKDRTSFVICRKQYLDSLKSNVNDNYMIKINKNYISWHGFTLEFEYSRENTSFFNQKIKDGMYVKHWERGDKYFSDYYSKHVKISNLFINNKISVFDKYRYPIIVNKKNDVLFIPNMYINPMLNNKLSLKLKV